jgi:chlorobactene glucosyltransferase
MLRGEPLPDGWLGKHWACHQLVRASTGELVLFVDSDTVVGPDVVRDAVDDASHEEADLFSVLPTRVSRPWVDRLVSAMIGWACMAWLPIRIAHSVSNPYLSAAFGPFMLFRKDAYEAIGGHRAIRKNSLDDFELARAVKAAGLRWRLYDGTGRVFTDDYVTPADALDGLGRSVFPVFGYSVPTFTVVWMGLAALGLGPIAVVAMSVFGGDVGGVMLTLSLVTILLLVTSWAITCVRFDYNPLLAPAYPLPVVLTLYVGLRSMLRSVHERHTWKGRALRGVGPHSLTRLFLRQREGPTSEGEEAGAPEPGAEPPDSGRL